MKMKHLSEERKHISEEMNKNYLSYLRIKRKIFEERRDDLYCVLTFYLEGELKKRFEDAEVVLSHPPKNPDNGLYILVRISETHSYRFYSRDSMYGTLIVDNNLLWKYSPEDVGEQNLDNFKYIKNTISKNITQLMKERDKAESGGYYSTLLFWGKINDIAREIEDITPESENICKKERNKIQKVICEMIHEMDEKF